MFNTSSLTAAPVPRARSKPKNTYAEIYGSLFSLVPHQLQPPSAFLWLADEAHQRGLAIGIKNAPDQVKDLVEHFDFAITEDAFYYGWAEKMNPFIAAGKPVFAAEYTDLPGDFDAFCEKSRQLKFSTILQQRGLDAWLKTCP